MHKRHRPPEEQANHRHVHRIRPRVRSPRRPQPDNDATLPATQFPIVDVNGTVRTIYNNIKEILKEYGRKFARLSVPFLRKLGAWVKKLVEFLRLKTNASLRADNIQAAYRNPFKLISKLRECRRALAAAVTGVAVNVTASSVLPFFVPAALLNAWQVVVASIDYHRARCEVERRRRSSVFFRVLFQRIDSKWDVVADIVLGCMLKLLVMACIWGIVGFDIIAEAFLDQTNASKLADTLVEKYSGAAATTADAAVPSLFNKAALPESVVIADRAREHAFNIFGNKIGQALSQWTGHDIANETSWAAFSSIVIEGKGSPEAIAQLAAAGAAAELIQPVGHGMEALGERLNREIHRVNHKLKPSTCCPC